MAATFSNAFLQYQASLLYGPAAKPTAYHVGLLSNTAGLTATSTLADVAALELPSNAAYGYTARFAISPSGGSATIDGLGRAALPAISVGITTVGSSLSAGGYFLVINGSSGHGSTTGILACFETGALVIPAATSDTFSVRLGITP
jgi:hypothetical protein